MNFLVLRKINRDSLFFQTELLSGGVSPMKENKKIIIVTTIISVVTTFGILYFIGFFKNDEEEQMAESEYGTDFFPEDETEYGTDFPYPEESETSIDDEAGSYEPPQLTPEESYRYSMGPLIEYMLAEVEDLREFFETVDVRNPDFDRLELITTNMDTIHDTASNTKSEYVPYDYKSIHTDILNAMLYIRLAGGSIDFLADGGEGFEHYLTLDKYKRDTQDIYDNAEILQQIYDGNFQSQ